MPKISPDTNLHMTKHTQALNKIFEELVPSVLPVKKAQHITQSFQDTKKKP